MSTKLFWKNWPTPYRLLYWGLITLFLVCISWFAYNYLSGTDAIIGWGVLAKTDRLQVLVDTIKTGPFALNTSAENVIFFQQYYGSMPAVNIGWHYFFLAVTVLSFNILFAVVSALPRLWYFAGTALFAFVLVNFKMELLMLFGSEEKWGLIIALVMFLPTSYYFNRIKPATSFLKRLLVFLAFTTILAIVIVFFAEVDTPFLYLSAYSIVNPLVIALVFILIVAHEIIAAFICLLSSTGKVSGKKAMLHFYIISGVYLVNLALVYLYETRVIYWDLVYINLFLLLFISAVLGFWGFRQRETQYKYLFNFYPFGGIAYVTMAIICFATLAHFTATFNDPVIEVFRNFIMYAHLGYGLIFILYISSNFLDLFKRSMPVYKVLYKPTNMPYFTFRLAGLIAFIAFLVKENWEIPVNQSISAYYNGVADLHYYNRELRLAETYYEEGARFGYKNHKSHYMLGQLATIRKDDVKAAGYYKSAIAKNPTPQSYVNLSNLYMDESRFFDALFILNEGLEKLPGNGHILNNQGINYAKSNFLDTAAYFLNEASLLSTTKAAAGSNIVALLAKNDININADSVLSDFDIEDDPISLNNSFVLKSRAREYLDKDFNPEDSTLSFLEASIMYNEAFNHLFDTDTLDVKRLRGYANVPKNINVRENLELIACLNLYHNKNVSQAVRRLNWLANTSSFNGGKYFNIVGLWALEQDAPDVAIEYFTWAIDKNHPDALFNLAIAHTENGDTDAAKSIWGELLQVGDRQVKEMAQTMLQLLNTTDEDYDGYTDYQKYLYTRYTLDYRDTTRFNELLKGIVKSDHRGQAILDMSKKLWQKDRTQAAVDYYARLSGLEITDQELFECIQWYELRMLAAQGNIRGLSTKINQGIDFDKDHLLQKHYFTALINEASGDTTNARKNYEFIAYKNPFLEEATIAAANFLSINDKFEAYNILLNAIEINPRSVKLLKAYILQCAQVQLNSYAKNSLEDLQPLISESAFRKFVNQYQELVKKVEEAERNF